VETTLAPGTIAALVLLFVNRPGGGQQLFSQRLIKADFNMRNVGLAKAPSDLLAANK